MRWSTAEPTREEPSCRVEKVAYAFRAVCSCGWVSKFVPTEQQARNSWTFHRAKQH